MQQSESNGIQLQSSMMSSLMLFLVLFPFIKQPCNSIYFSRNGLRDLGPQQRYKRFRGRIVVLSIVVLLLYPFLLAWTFIGTLWFKRAKNCVSLSSFVSSEYELVHNMVQTWNGSNVKNHFQLPEDGQKWGFLIWLLFSYCGLVCIACICTGRVSFFSLSSTREFSFFRTSLLLDKKEGNKIRFSLFVICVYI